MADLDDEIQARIHAAVADYYTAGEVDALLKSRDDRVAALEKRVAALEATPAPTPVPVPLPPSAGSYVVGINGTSLTLNGAAWRPAGHNDPSLAGHDTQAPTLAAVEARFKVLGPGTFIRTFMWENIPTESIAPVLEIGAKYGIVFLLSLADGAENPGTPENYNPAWYSGGYKGRFWAHATRSLNRIKGLRNIILQPMNETAHRGDGASTDQIIGFESAVVDLCKSIMPHTPVFSGVCDTYYGWSDSAAELTAIMRKPDGMDMHSYEARHSNNFLRPNRWPANRAILHGLNKPIILGEFGAAKTGSTSHTRVERAAIAKSIMDSTFREGAAATAYWRVIRPGAYADGDVMANGDSVREPWDTTVDLMLRNYKPPAAAA